MLYTSQELENRAALDAAARICAAARTAPKTKGMDGLVTCVVTGEEKDRLSAQMRKLASELNYAFFSRDADNVDASAAVVLLAMHEKRRGLDAGCRYCHFADCTECTEKDGLCAWDAIDLGIALGSAAATAADLRVDSRVMFSVGRTAMSLGLPDKDATLVMGIPVSISGKSPYFDRKSK